MGQPGRRSRDAVLLGLRGHCQASLPGHSGGCHACPRTLIPFWPVFQASPCCQLEAPTRSVPCRVFRKGVAFCRSRSPAEPPRSPAPPQGAREAAFRPHTCAGHPRPGHPQMLRVPGVTSRPPSVGAWRVVPQPPTERRRTAAGSLLRPAELGTPAGARQASACGQGAGTHLTCAPSQRPVSPSLSRPGSAVDAWRDNAENPSQGRTRGHLPPVSGPDMAPQAAGRGRRMKGLPREPFLPDSAASKHYLRGLRT